MVLGKTTAGFAASLLCFASGVALPNILCGIGASACCMTNTLSDLGVVDQPPQPCCPKTAWQHGDLGSPRATRLLVAS